MHLNFSFHLGETRSVGHTESEGVRSFGEGATERGVGEGLASVSACVCLCVRVPTIEERGLSEGARKC